MAPDRKSDTLKSPEIHSAAAVGFGRAADAYERGRPEYPLEVVEFIVDQLNRFRNGRSQLRGVAVDTEKGPDEMAPLTVLDLAAGTGKFTKILAVLDPSLVSQIVAVEPVGEMRTKIEVLLAAQNAMGGDSPAAPRVKSYGAVEGLPTHDNVVRPTVTVVAGTAEAIPLSTSSCDVVTVAQAFHWFDGTRALTEIHRVLKPGGILIMLWNVRDESHSWVREMTDLMTPYEGAVPRYRSFNWKKPFDHSLLFTPLTLTKFTNLTSGTIETMLDRVASVSFVASLSERDRSELLTRMREFYEKQLDRNSGLIEMPYETHIFMCFRK